MGLAACYALARAKQKRVGLSYRDVDAWEVITECKLLLSEPQRAQSIACIGKEYEDSFISAINIGCVYV